MARGMLDAELCPILCFCGKIASALPCLAGRARLCGGKLVLSTTVVNLFRGGTDESDGGMSFGRDWRDSPCVELGMGE